MSSVHDRPWAGQGPASAVHVSSAAQAAMPLVQQRTLELARALLPTQRAVLVRALTPDVLALHTPYAPASAEEEQVAATLAHPTVGLLWPETMRPGRVYSPTPLGRLVLHAYLLERVAGEPLGAWAERPEGAHKADHRAGRRSRGWGHARHQG